MEKCGTLILVKACQQLYAASYKWHPSCKRYTRVLGSERGGHTCHDTAAKLEGSASGCRCRLLLALLPAYTLDIVESFHFNERALA